MGFGSRGRLGRIEKSKEAALCTLLSLLPEEQTHIARPPANRAPDC